MATPSSAVPAHEARAASRTNRIIWVSAFALLATGSALIGWAHARDSSPVYDGSWWAILLFGAGFAAAEFLVFDVHIGDEGISFGIAEVPLAFALVYVSPWPALMLRLVLAAVVLSAVRKNRGSKLVYNLGLQAINLGLMVVLFRALHDAFGEDRVAAVEAVMVSMIVAQILNSLLIDFAISQYVGNFRRLVIDDMANVWWLQLINSAVAAMCIALALLQPALVLVAVPAFAGMWYVMRSFGRVSQQLRDLDTLHGFAGRIGSTLDVDEIAHTAIREVIGHLRADGAILVRFDGDAPIVVREGRVSVRPPRSGIEPEWGAVWRSDGVLLSPGDILAAGIQAEGKVSTVLAAPLNDEAGPIGVLLAAEAPMQRVRFDDAALAKFRNIAHQLSLSLRRGLLHERLEYEARHDALTGLPARTLFERAVADAIATPDERVAAVMMLDLDRFKEVNDTLGHHAGDALLIEFSRRMSTLLDDGDMLARLAGDEFAILCRRADADAAIDVARACVTAGGRPVVLDGLEIVVTVSVGVALIGEVETDPLQPMRRADIAMYNAKWQRTGVEVYRDEIDRRTPARLSMLGDLRAAIEHDEIDVLYQAKLDLRSHAIVGAEALVRWNSPTRGVVAPAEFVRVAEDTGLIKDLTDLVLKRGIAALRQFDDRGLGLRLAVNLSTHDLFDTKLPTRVLSQLEIHGVDPSAVTLEITESSLLIDAPRTRATIDDLHQAGFRLAVDDFGTGYSSLSYLRRLPVQELKIDQSFVSHMLTDPQDEVIVKSTIDLGHNLQLSVVAEGVEDEATLDALAEMGCDIAQGYAIARPLTADELIAWVGSVRRDGLQLQNVTAADDESG